MKTCVRNNTLSKLLLLFAEVMISLILELLLQPGEGEIVRRVTTVILQMDISAVLNLS
jgi:hypothetical protein